MKDHKVAQGDCINSIAYENGFFWQTLWDHPKNAALKEKRKNPNILSVGDAVHIPDKGVKWLHASVEKKNRFQLKGVPARLRLAFHWAGEPRKKEPYILEVDGKVLKKGMTDENGVVEAGILPTAKAGKVTIGEGFRKIVYELHLGHLDPVADATGVKARLKNLGFLQEEPDRVTDDELEEALMAFQSSRGLEPSGLLDESSRELLEDEHEKAG